MAAAHGERDGHAVVCGDARLVSRRNLPAAAAIAGSVAGNFRDGREESREVRPGDSCGVEEVRQRGESRCRRTAEQAGGRNPPPAARRENFGGDRRDSPAAAFDRDEGGGGTAGRRRGRDATGMGERGEAGGDSGCVREGWRRVAEADQGDRAAGNYLRRNSHGRGFIAAGSGEAEARLAGLRSIGTEHLPGGILPGADAVGNADAAKAVAGEFEAGKLPAQALDAVEAFQVAD